MGRDGIGFCTVSGKEGIIKCINWSEINYSLGKPVDIIYGSSFSYHKISVLETGGDMLKKAPHLSGLAWVLVALCPEGSCWGSVLHLFMSLTFISLT